MKTTIRTDHRALAEALRCRVLEGPGKTPTALRQAVAQRAAGGQAAEAPAPGPSTALPSTALYAVKKKPALLPAFSHYQPRYPPPPKLKLTLGPP